MFTQDMVLPSVSTFDNANRSCSAGKFKIEFKLITIYNRNCSPSYNNG